MFSLFLCLSFVAVSVTSCSEDEPVLETTKFVGTYSGQEACNNGNFNPTLTIAESSTVEDRIIINHSDGYAINATVTGDSYLIDLQQIIIDNAALTVSGSGSLNVTALNGTINYSLNGQGNSCTWTFNKQ